MKSIVHFQNERNDTLRGVFHSPEKSNFNGRKDIIIFPNSGLMSAEGDYRSHYRIANYLTQKGFYILRFNPSGIGLSDGYIAECRQRDLFGQIETGLFVNDIRAAANFVQSTGRFDSITLSGICGGAISSFLAAAQLNEVNYVIPIGIAVILDTDKVEYDSRMPKEEARFLLSMYIRKLFSPDSWFRFIMLKSNVSMIKKSIFNIFHRDISYADNNKLNTSLQTNPAFFDAARQLFAKKKRILFIFGDSDNFWWEFESLFLNKYYMDRNKLPFDFYLVSRGNHMLSWTEMQLDAAAKIFNWLKNELKK